MPTAFTYPRRPLWVKIFDIEEEENMSRGMKWTWERLSGSNIRGRRHLFRGDAPELFVHGQEEPLHLLGIDRLATVEVFEQRLLFLVAQVCHLGRLALHRYACSFL